MNTINALESLKDAPLSISRFIGVSAINIINAGIVANDTAEAAAEAKRIYGKLRHFNGGFYKKVQADARRVLRTCEREGMTLNKPYVIKSMPHAVKPGVTEVGLFTVLNNGDLVPVKFWTK